MGDFNQLTGLIDLATSRQHEAFKTNSETWGVKQEVLRRLEGAFRSFQPRSRLCNNKNRYRGKFHSTRSRTNYINKRLIDKQGEAVKTVFHFL